MKSISLKVAVIISGKHRIFHGQFYEKGRVRNDVVIAKCLAVLAFYISRRTSHLNARDRGKLLAVLRILKRLPRSRKEDLDLEPVVAMDVPLGVDIDGGADFKGR